jgi:hypothetical protein
MRLKEEQCTSSAVSVQYVFMFFVPFVVKRTARELPTSEFR